MASQTLDNDDNGDELVEEKVSESLDAVKKNDAKETISINAADDKPNYLKSTKKNDDDANKENTSKEEKLSNQLKAKLLGAKANLTAFLLKNKKDLQNRKGNWSVSWQPPKLRPRRPWTMHAMPLNEQHQK